MKFLVWHYTEGIKNFIKIWKNYIWFFWRFFSVGLLARTLLSPWHRDVFRVARSGFHPALWLQSVLQNAITRILGAVARSGVILTAVLAELAVFILGGALLLVWMLFPIVFIAALGGIIFSVKSGLTIATVIEFVLFALGLVIILISLKACLNSGVSYESLSLVELSRFPWFKRVWNRIGKDVNDPGVNSVNNPKLFGEFLRSCDITPEEFKQIVDWELKSRIERERQKKFWSRRNLASVTPLGRTWSYAYTAHLDKYAVDLSEDDPTEYKDARVFGREKELAMLELILSRPNQNNALLIGEAGVGRSSLIHYLARKIRNGEAGPALLMKRVLKLDIGQVISGLTAKGEIKEMLNSMFYEAAYAGNVILVVDNLDAYLKANPKNPGENISTVLVDYLPHPTFQVIGVTTPEGFHRDIEKMTNVMKFFEKIQLEEMNPENTLKVLFNKLKGIEKEKVIVTYQALREIIRLSDRYVSDTPFPEKALDLLEEVLLYWSEHGLSELVTPEAVNKVVSRKFNVPVGDIGEDESRKLINLEKVLHQRVIGQDFAIKQLAEAMRRARIGMADKDKPLGAFLFIGPTGVGKTESAKALAEAYFGNEERMIRVDMSEFQTQESIDRLIGSVKANREGYLTGQVKENPYSLLLLDEIEKAHPDILNLFLQVLDEGWLTDAFGKKINFRNLIIIATSNAGSKIIRDGIQTGLNSQEIQKKVTDYAIKQGIFRPELLNRFEGVIFFHPLSQDDIVRVTELMLGKYSRQLKEERNIVVRFDSDVAPTAAQMGFDPVFGARAIDRFIQDKIEDVIVKKIVNGEIKEGQDFVFRARDIKGVIKRPESISA